MSSDTVVPVDYRYLVEKFSALVPIAGSAGGPHYRYLVEKFSALVPTAGSAGGRHATEADGVYLLESSRHYVIVVFADKPTDVARFCLLVAAQSHCSLSLRYVPDTLQAYDSQRTQRVTNNSRLSTRLLRVNLVSF